jgi:hypothetical protein
MNSFDFSKSDSKTLVDGFYVQVIGGLAHIALQSGSKTQVFAVQLSGAKGLGRALTKQVEIIEKQTGQTFDVILSDEPRPSPLSGDPK